MILNCFCKNEFQDKLYGSGKRVFNRCGGGHGGSTEYRCATCKDTQRPGGMVEKGAARAAKKQAAKKAA
jgi:hypothetical protein